MDMKKRDRIRKRMSVSLDLESANIIQKLQAEWQISKSEVVRRALDYLDVVKKEEGSISSDELGTIIKLFHRPDVVSIDVSILEVLSEEVGEGSEEFKEEINLIGGEIYSEYCDMGISTPLECLRTMEKTNLFDVIVDSENSFTLVGRGRKTNKFLKVFLEGFFEASPHQAKVKAKHGKIRVRITEEAGSS